MPVAAPNEMLYSPATQYIRRRVPAVFMRAGTSRGLFLLRNDLPKSQSEWLDIITKAMGSPDTNLRQLDGMGSGTSTTSKVAVVSLSKDSRADVDYLFIQVSTDRKSLDYNGNCGNMASGVGPFAIDAGIIPIKNMKEHQTVVRIRNINTNVIMHSNFLVRDGVPVESGSFVLDGVGVPGSPIKLDFKNPGGSMTGKVLPTGNLVDTVQVYVTNSSDSLQPKNVRVSCVDSGNPVVFVYAQDLGLRGTEVNEELVPYTEVLMEIRATMSVKMGLTNSLEEALLSQGTPKVALVAAPNDYVTPSGRLIRREECDILVRAFSMGRPHPTVQMTGAVCLASSCSIRGTVPYDIVHSGKDSMGGDFSSLRLGHASGTMTTESRVVAKAEKTLEVESASVYRTARRLMEGSVLYLASVVHEQSILAAE